MSQRQFLCAANFYSCNMSSFPFNLCIFSAFTVLCCENVYRLAVYFCEELPAFILNLLPAGCACGSSAVGPFSHPSCSVNPVLWQGPVKLLLWPAFSRLKNCRLFTCSLNRSYSLDLSFLPFLSLFVTLKHTGKTGAIVGSGSHLGL